MGDFASGQGGLFARLKSRRGIAAIVLLAALGGGGWYYFMPGPQSASGQSANAMYMPKSGAKSTTPIRKGGAGPASKPSAVPLPATQPSAQSLSTKITKPVIIVEHIADVLGAQYIDAEHGFEIRLPLSWAVRTFSAEPWVLDCNDGGSGLISIGFTPCAKEITADHLLPEGIARKIKKQKNTKVLGQGKTMIAGRKALWFKATGPMQLSNGSPVMTRVEYVVPLGDGRALHLRVASSPEQFNALGGVMKQSIDTLKMLPK